MGLPRKLTHFATFVDGTNYMGEMPEVTLPTLTRKMEEYRGGGMNGPIDLDMGQEKMEAELKGAGWIKGLMSKWGAGKHDALMLRFAGAVQTEEDEAPTVVEVVMRGRLSEMDPGSAKAGEKTEFSVKTAAAYYKLSINGDTLIELDFVNGIEVVNGTDLYADIRAAIGL